MAEHQWRRIRGEVDHFAHEVDVEDVGHNGPWCDVCDLFFCEHCQPDAWKFECPGPAPEGREWSWIGDGTSAGRPRVPELFQTIRERPEDAARARHHQCSCGRCDLAAGGQ